MTQRSAETENETHAWGCNAARERNLSTSSQVSVAEDVGQVPVHGVLAEHELAGDVGVGQSLRDEFE
jgi:hypothetical protein